MNDSITQRLVRKAGMYCLAIMMIVASGGLAYVVHITQETSQRLGNAGPSVLPLIALSVLSAIAGLATLRFAWGVDPEMV